MDSEGYARYKARAHIFKALAHPARLFIVHELSQQERCVNDLTRMLGIDASTVSRHLSVLRHAGIVDSDKRGSQVFYYLKVPCILNFCSCIESALESSAKEKLDQLS